MLNSRRTAAAACAALLALAVVRIVSTYGVFNQTYDEPFHLLRGMLWVTGQDYRHVDHPPLAPVLLALGPWLDGAEVIDTGSKYRDGNEVLYGRGRYFRTLGLARAGNVVFLALSVVMIGLWSSWAFGRATAIAAVFLYTNLPPVLAHGGLATTDMAITAALTTFLYALMRWLSEATAFHTVLLGISTGLAVLSKMSAVAFLPLTWLAIVMLYQCSGHSGNGRRRSWGESLVDMGIIALIACSLLWGGYRFSLGPVGPTPESRVPRFVEELLARQDSAGSIARGLMTAAVPAPEYYRGILSALGKAERGHAPYFLGRPRHDEASWLFFPIVFAVKTPLPFQVLLAIGIGAVVTTFRRSRDWRQLAALVAAGVMFVAVLPSPINLGIRHILPVYPLLSISAAHGLVTLCRTRVGAASGIWVGAALCCWMLISSLAVHPDYLSYFNETASKHPEQVVVDSDLDWGQDLHRLAEELKTRGINHVSLAYFGTARPEMHGLPDFVRLRPRELAYGWIAISLTALKMEEGYSWLEAHKSVATVGRSMRLYYVDPAEGTPTLHTKR